MRCVIRGSFNLTIPQIMRRVAIFTALWIKHRRAANPNTVQIAAGKEFPARELKIVGRAKPAATLRFDYLNSIAANPGYGLPYFPLGTLQLTSAWASPTLHLA